MVGAVGDYAVSIGTTGADYPLTQAGISILPNGAFVWQKGLRFADIRDGLSSTILVGDKHVPLGNEGSWPWDCSIYDGHNLPCATRAAGPGFPLAPKFDDTRWLFGSSHPGICQFVFADGSVQILRTSISETTFGLLAHRSDGQVIPEY